MLPRRFRPQVLGLEGREVPAALLQVIHNAPYPAAAAVDVYVNNLLPPELTDLRFREATPFLTLPSAVPVVVSVRPAGASVATAPVFTQTFNFAEGSKNIAVALGDPAQATGTAVTKFQLLATTAARTQAAVPGNAEFLVGHGSPDAPPVDVKVRGGGTLVNDLSYPGFAPGYVSVAPGNYTVDVTLADGVSRVGSFAADLSGAAGKALTVLASGFVGTLPAGADAANTFGLLAVTSDGTTALLPRVAGPALGTTFAAGATGKATAADFTGKALFSASPFGEVAVGGDVPQNRVAAADVTGDGVADLIAGRGPAGVETTGGASRVVVIDGATQKTLAAFEAFEGTFRGGVYVAAGDLTGDGKAEVVVTPDQGGGPVVAVYDGAALAAGKAAEAAQLGRFFGIDDPAFRGGARAAVGDVSGDGKADLVAAAGFGGGPRLAVFDGRSVVDPGTWVPGSPPPTGPASKLPRKLTGDFFVFEPTLRNGVFVTAGDIDADGAADVIVGGGPGGGPRVYAVSGRDLVAATGKQTPVANFFAGDPANRDGVRVAAKDLDGDQFADLVVGLGSAGTPQVRGFRGTDFPATVSKNATPPAVAALELNPFPGQSLVFVG